MRDERFGLLRLPEEAEGEHLPADDLSDLNTYRKHFAGVTFDAKDIDKVIEMVGEGKKIMTICARGGLFPASAFKALFIDAGIPYDKRINNLLKELRKIDLKDIDDLDNLDLREDDVQDAAFEAAYQKAKPLEPSVASITFTPELDVDNDNTSAVEDLQLSAKENIKYLGPIQDFIRNINQINEGLAEIVGQKVLPSLSIESYKKLLKNVFKQRTVFKNETLDPYLPDLDNFTRYPNYAFKDGQVPSLGLLSLYGNSVSLRDFEGPSWTEEDLQSRISLG